MIWHGKIRQTNCPFCLYWVAACRKYGELEPNFGDVNANVSLLHGSQSHPSLIHNLRCKRRGQPGASFKLVLYHPMHACELDANFAITTQVARKVVSDSWLKLIWPGLIEKYNPRQARNLWMTHHNLSRLIIKIHFTRASKNQVVFVEREIATPGAGFVGQKVH